METSRREFLQKSAALAGAALVSPGLTPIPRRRKDEIRLGLIGCGGRGSGAVRDAMSANPNVRLVAAGDVFRGHLENSVKQLAERYSDDRMDVPKSRQFVGFDAYKQVLALDLDVVILATPPHFRPAHFEAAVAAGKHVFMEKPVAVDGYGIRQVLKASEAAKQKKLNVVVGLQRHYQNGYRSIIEKVHAGEIGDIVAARAYWNSGFLWSKPRQESWSDVEFQLKNWLYYAWLSGDHIVEQHVHNLDVVNWAKNDFPKMAYGMGGRQVRTDALFGHIFDHHAVHYQYADGSWMFSQCRQISGCHSQVSEHLIGTQGTADFHGGRYELKKHGGDTWAYEGENNNPYVSEHVELYKAIEAGEHRHWNADYGAMSTLTAIMGRMATYSGKAVTQKEALDSERLGPDQYAFGSIEMPPVPVPGS